MVVIWQEIYILSYNPSNIFARMLLFLTRYMIEYSPIFKTVRLAKKINFWSFLQLRRTVFFFLNTIAFFLGKTMLGYLSLDILQSFKANSFPQVFHAPGKLFSSCGTENVHVPMSRPIFAPKGVYTMQNHR